ncbi:MAG: hypothetical protein IH873_03135 [Chloroflexi bacterium]|nr:hypothetical protein [Chloroflexota bacterium]
MAQKVSFPVTSGTLQKIGSGLVLLGVVAVGVLTLLYFWNQLLRPGDLNAISLPLVALVAGIAATFNPCGLPALPGFLAFGGENIGLGRRSGLSLATAFGAMTIIIVLGIIVAIAGTGTKGLIAPYFRWVQLAVGLVLVSVAVLHLGGQTNRLPLVGQVMGMGSRIWEHSMGSPTPKKSYLFGAGFVVVGVG